MDPKVSNIDEWSDLQLDYLDKLKIFHDSFVMYSLEEIERQQRISSGLDVPNVPTAAEKILSSISMIPVLGFCANLATFLIQMQIRDKEQAIKLTKILNFKDSYTIKLMLSNAIRKVAIDFKHTLEKAKDPQEIREFSALATLKFINYLKTNILYHKNGSPNKFQNKPILTEKFIIDSIQQYSEHSTDILYNLPKSDGDLLLPELEFESDVFRIDRIEELVKEVQLERQEHKEAQEFPVPLKSERIYFYNVRGAVHNFIGREAELTEITEYFAANADGIQVIGGLGGIGKTQTSLKYVAQYKRLYDYRVRWIYAENKASISLSFREFAKSLGMNIDRKSGAEMLAWIKAKLSSEIEKSLLIFDNAEDFELVRRYLPDTGGKKQHNVIIITRNTRDWSNSDSYSNIKILTLESFKRQEVINYIKKILPKESENDASALAGLFDDIPLGLSQSVAYVKNNAISIKVYLAEYERLKQQSPAYLEMLQDGKYDPHILSIYNTLSMILKNLSNEPKTLELLKFCSFLNSDNIPEYLFDTLFKSETEKNRSIAILKGYSLISIRTDGNSGVELLYIHKIVQQVVKMTLGDEYKQYLQRTAELVHSKMSDDKERTDVIDVVKNNPPLLQHANSLIEHHDNLILDEDNSEQNSLNSAIANLHNDCGQLYYALRSPNAAKEQFEKALKMKEKTCGQSGVELAKAINLIGKACYSAGKYQEALDNYEKALKILDAENSANESSERAIILHNMGNVYKVLGRYEEASTKSREALRINRMIHGDNSEEVAGNIHAIGNIYYDLGRYKEALQNYEESLKIKRSSTNDQSFGIAMTMHAMGKVYYSIKEYDLALNILEEALSIKKRIFGEMHTDVAITLNSIGSVHHALGVHQEALTKYVVALPIFKAAYGNMHHEVAITYRNIGNVYYTLGRYQEALVKLEESLLITQAIYPADHHETKITINEIYKSKYPYIINNDNIMLLSFAFKEVIEAAPIISYLYIEILHLPKITSLEFLNNNYILMGVHYVACNIGMLTIASKPDFVTPFMLTTAYGVKVYSYEYLSEQRYKFINDIEKKTINDPVEFFEKCSAHIITYAALGAISSKISGITNMYTVAISATSGGVQCYQIYNDIHHYSGSMIGQVVPYIVDVVVGCYMTYNINFNLSTPQVGKMLAMQQVVAALSLVVQADYMTKLLISYYEESYFGYVSNFVGNVYEYFFYEKNPSEL